MSSNTDIGGTGATKKLRIETEGTLDAQTEAPAVEPIFDFEFTLVNVDTVIADLVRAKNKVELEKLKTALETMMEYLNQKSKRLGLSGDEKKAIDAKINTASYGLGKISLQTLPNESESPTPSRVSSITAGLDTPLVQKTDLEASRARVDELFGWYASKKEGYRKYVAPYFPMIQSSGMGKTRLFVELRRSFVDENYKKVMESRECFNPDKQESNEDKEMREQQLSHCFMILCQRANDIQNDHGGFFFQGTMKIEDKYEESVATMDTILLPLYNLFSKNMDYIYKQDKVVLLFDEAQSLVNSTNGFPFRCILKWLRYDVPRANIVAVFAGTTSALTQ
jgi:hypothetical protein